MILNFKIFIYLFAYLFIFTFYRKERETIPTLSSPAIMQLWPIPPSARISRLKESFCSFPVSWGSSCSEPPVLCRITCLALNGQVKEWHPPTWRKHWKNNVHLLCVMLKLPLSPSFFALRRFFFPPPSIQNALWKPHFPAEPLCSRPGCFFSSEMSQGQQRWCWANLLHRHPKVN